GEARRPRPPRGMPASERLLVEGPKASVIELGGALRRWCGRWVRGGLRPGGRSGQREGGARLEGERDPPDQEGRARGRPRAGSFTRAEGGGTVGAAVGGVERRLGL